MLIRLILCAGLEVLLMAQACASESESLRLFRGLANSGIENDKSIQLDDKGSTGESSISPVTDTLETPVVPELKLEGGTYHYNGFISSLHGDYYFINGIRITELASIELVSINNAGRSLQLRTANGDVFVIAIGETRFAVPVRKKNRIRVSDDNDAL